MTDLKVRLTFTEEVLGTLPSDPDIHRTFIATKAPDASTIEDEVAAVGVDETVEKGTTIFAKTEDGEPFLYDYQIKGFFKEACSCMKKVKGSLSEKIKAFKKEIDGLIFVEPRAIPIDMHGGEMGDCQRPLRASTAQGERVTLAHSETVPAGSTVDFTIKCLVDSDADLVKEWLEYGQYKGIGQWRNSSKGRFNVEYL